VLGYKACKVINLLPMIDLEFYTTAGCHLCEQAIVLCEQYILSGAITVHSVDIADSEHLVEKYGVRIPVIKRMDNNNELGWPFDEVGLAKFLGVKREPR